RLRRSFRLDNEDGRLRAPEAWEAVTVRVRGRPARGRPAGYLGAIRGRIAMPTRKDRRFAFAPDVVGLEDRRLMTAGVGPARAREILSGTTDVLIIKGSAGADRVTIDDDGSGSAGNVKVTFADGRTYVSKGAVEV